jgi:glyoxalase family protein
VKGILGIHHVTAIASDPQRNIDFYTGLLGLRLVKLTVNYDDPGSYHLYYGDELGHPGTILTFFAWPEATPGYRGTRQATSVSFSVPHKTLGFWIERFKHHDVNFGEPIERFDEQALVFFDPDGLQLELVAQAAESAGADARHPWKDGPVPAEYAIRGFHSVALSEQDDERTASLLTETLGFRRVGKTRNRIRYEVGAGNGGALVDVLSLPDEKPGRVAVGTVHHVAWRTPDDQQQVAFRREIVKRGHDVTPVIDRTYFHSIYFREPGGVLFEIATDPPGFTVDEQVEQLGSRLTLPSWLEPSRAQIEHGLPPIHLPQIMEKV